MILDTSTVDEDVSLRSDACVIGSGAGGSVVARELAAGGMDVVLIEEGGYWTSRDFTQLEEEMYPRLYRERGTRPTSDFSVLVSQGRALGGSTLVSFCLCFRPPSPVLSSWAERTGIEALAPAGFLPAVERVERSLPVRRMGADHLNANNRILKTGGERLGLRGRFLDHNRTDCLGCGYCALGCAYDRKNDAIVTYLADASHRGARILPWARADRVLYEGREARGVVGRFLRSRTGARRSFRVDARVVVIAGGALESPMLWLRSSLPNPGGVVGRHLRLNPYVVVAGIFDERVATWEGVPQSWVVDEFLDPVRFPQGGLLFFSASAQPIACAGLLPGFGWEHRRGMHDVSRMAMIAVFLNDRAEGHVSLGRRGEAVIRYELGGDDQVEVKRGLRLASEMLFAAGAERVVLPYNDLVELAKPEDARVIDERGIFANDPLFLSFHPQGTLRIGAVPRRSVVGRGGESHEVRGLYVADASVLPGAVGVPPQVSIMAFATETARAILGTLPARLGS
ncbi:MAG: hypothetical protein QOD06_355 [Candidatus Binatota bacterium]|nr:hypothetical protein [Candidatus Binatota bacterium]